MDNLPTDLSKRQLLAGTVAAAAALATSGLAQAGHVHHKHANGVGDDLVAAANDCVQKGEACLSHCMTLVEKKDTSIAGCMRTVSETIAICSAFAKLSNLNSKYTKDFGKICSAACEECAEECGKHAKHHHECKDCAESCKQVSKMIKAMA